MDLADFVAFSADNVSPIVGQWVEREEIIRRIQEELSATFARQALDPKWVEIYVKHCPVEGVPPSDYHLRYIDGGSDGQLLAGIHFRGRNIKEPFVGVLARTQPIEDEVSLSRWKDLLREEFQAFSPRYVRLFQAPETTELDLLNCSGARCDMRFLAGQVEAIRRRPAVEHESDIQVIPLETFSEEDHARYVEVYRRFHMARPGLKEHVNIQKRSELEVCADKDSLFNIEVDGQWAGLIAGNPAQRGALLGHEVYEEVLNVPFWGRNIAPVAQRRFIDQLPITPGGLIFGTIDERNQPSLRTALRVGRSEVGHDVFVPF